MHRRRRSAVRRGFSLIEATLAVFLVGVLVLMFGSLYLTAARTARMSGNYAQAISAVQHKVDQLRAVGYGRLHYAELRAAGIVDAAPQTSPYRFEAVDGLDQELPSPTGTITITQMRPNLRQATVRLEWQGAPGKAMEGWHEVTVLIANE